ncbi:putative YTH domain-containing family protein 3 [Apostichopus japonicus]|uniref:Putative YTH domain-containing family protein 3 n=1 Tax=Stichopus japonicus TaxID=307972 RepID=A0A2G8KZ85_STIJA|nr:putative YTH domain-containing family protein 3 [Apostichopus japonicus]
MGLLIIPQKSKPQRSQAQNGPVNPKEVSSENSFERYMPNQVTQGYPAAPANMAPADTYMASYYPSTYSFPYSMPGSENTWSTGGDNFNSTYNYDFSYPTDYYNQPGTTPPYLGQSFNFFPPGNPDYTQGAWSGQGQAGAPTGPSSYYDYSRYPGAQASAGVHRTYQGVNGYEVQDGKAHGMKAVEQGMSVLHISPGAGDKVTGGVVGTNGKVDPRTGQTAGTASFSQAAAGGGGGAPSGGGKQTSWAAIASKPAKPQPKAKSKSGSHAPVPTQLPSMKQPMAIGTWNTGDKPVGKVEGQAQPAPVPQPPNGSYAPQAVTPQNTPPVQAVRRNRW